MTAATDLQQRNAAFRAFLDTLNAAQRRAVDQTEGPVLVIAGPGTGKTHILTARIGKILLDTDTRPQNILCLTFTDAAVTAMRRRLLERIGPDAHRVPVFTFHAFCNRVIQENLEHFGRARLEPLTDLERIEIVREMLTKLPPEHPLRQGQRDAFHYETQLRNLFGTMKKEGWTPGWVLKKTDEYTTNLLQNPAFIYKRNTKTAKKGDLKAEKLETEREKMARVKAAADLYPKYLHALERAGRYEYEDMLLWVVRAFQRHKNLLRTYQERYLYIMVDEYQDTNGAQNQLLHQLLDFWETPNVFIVGDDDQSIYEFQGARLKNLLDFYRLYQQGLETIVLSENYRSTQALLNAATRVVEQNTLRAISAFDVPLEKKLLAQTTAANTPLLLEYPNRLHEATDLVARIEQCIQSGIPATEIAVLYARHRQSERLIRLLEKKGIPYQTKRPLNILDLPHIQQFRELLRYLNEELSRPFSGEHRLFRLLHAPFFCLNPLDLANAAAAKKLNREYAEALLNRAFQEKITTPSSGIAQPTGTMGLGVGLVGALPLPALIERLYTETGLLQYALNQPDKIWWLQTLDTFLEFVSAEAARNPRVTLGRLLTLLDSMDDNLLPMPLRQALQPANGVQILTAHAAKGLEFECVFMPDCTDDFWEKAGAGNNRHFALPDTLTLSGEEDLTEARRRLFYVAMTRAKRQLVISYPAATDDGKPLIRARFIEETGLPTVHAALPADSVTEAMTTLLREAAVPVVTLPESAVLDALMDNFALTVSNMNRYLRCPLAFYYVDVLKVPETESEHGVFGQAMHAALQQFFLKKMVKGQLFPTDITLQRMFVTEMEYRRSHFGEQNFAQRMALGKEYMRRYHAEQIMTHWRRRAVAERRIDRVEMEGVPLTGILDKIEWLDNGTLRVVDYKTGTPNPKKIAPPSDAQPNGGDYWRQLAFYRLLLEYAHIYAEPVRQTWISWLEPDKRGIFAVNDIAHTGEEIQFVKNLIHTTYTNIHQRRFAEGCGQPECVWCRMHRGPALLPIFDKTEEELDDRT
jgi:DNA helicase-2/ATP-dependent DNA helicase PcrA